MIEKKDIFLCPRIKDKLEKAKIEARGWSAFWDGRFCYGVRDGATQVKFVVDLRDRTCSCRSWQLNGIPCNHAVAAIWKNVEHPEHYVADCYKKIGYLKAYQFSTKPLNGPQEWPVSEYQPINPPPLKKLKAGRPKTKRRMQVGETSAIKLSKSGGGISCSKCEERGHNKRYCKSPYTTNSMERNNELEGTSSGRRQQSVPPMHQRGYGMYTYPNGFTRLASGTQPRRRMAYYTDNEGHQTIQSITTMHDNTPNRLSQTSSESNIMPPSFVEPNGRICITSQRLQDFARQGRTDLIYKDKLRILVQIDAQSWIRELHFFVDGI